MNYSQAILDIDKDLINNPAKRCACMVVLDTSFSMSNCNDGFNAISKL